MLNPYVIEPSLQAFANITARMVAIWSHAYSTFPDFDWYVRCWDDNYIFPERMSWLLSSYSPDKPLALGRMSERKEPYFFLNGGATWALSREALRRWQAHDGGNLGDCDPVPYVERYRAAGVRSEVNNFE